MQPSKDDSEVFICAVTNKQLSSNDVDMDLTHPAAILFPKPKMLTIIDTVQEVFGLEA